VAQLTQLSNRQWVFGQFWALLGSVGVAALAEPAGPGLPPSSEQRSPATLNREQSLLFALPTTRDHIGRVVVAATVNGKGPFRFAVDTGATHSTITPALVHVLGLKPSEAPTVVLNGITGTAQVAAVMLDKLQTGDFRHRPAARAGSVGADHGRRAPNLIEPRSRPL
jgi:hypothetical protein